MKCLAIPRREIDFFEADISPVCRGHKPQCRGAKFAGRMNIFAIFGISSSAKWQFSSDL